MAGVDGSTARTTQLMPQPSPRPPDEAGEDTLARLRTAKRRVQDRTRSRGRQE